MLKRHIEARLGTNQRAEVTWGQVAIMAGIVVAMVVTAWLVSK
jgi:hypothetical protein